MSGVKKLPKSIEILGVTIPINECSSEKNEIGDTTWGEYDSQLLEIRVNKDISYEHKKIVILHEALHCVEDFLSLKIPHSAIFALSQCFYSMVKQNPDIFDWVYSD